MNIENINKNCWNQIPKSDNSQNGYLGTIIHYTGEKLFDLLIFRDENDKKHFVVEIKGLRNQEITDPNINGLKLNIKQFKFNGKNIKTFIDLECNMDDYIDEFTEIVKEISKEIIIFKNSPIQSVTKIIENWKSFWSSKIKEILTVEKQIGLLCELIVLKRLCEINPSMALDSWKGPLGEKHDFTFSDWNFEIKGTSGDGHIHWINGIDQLKLPEKKNLAFISFLLTGPHSNNSISIQSLIESIVLLHLKNKPTLIENFYKKLISVGYSRFFAEEYKKYGFEIHNSILFHIDENFPKLTSENLKKPLNFRISDIQYKIDLQGLYGQDLSSVNLSTYFY
ncbi:MAG: PD-(D/E)XK motif protein [Sphingobacteriales bacterium]|nr:MAG: PD-(D/E)XK motif protein [Sphingobacteriales bacterium]